MLEVGRIAKPHGLQGEVVVALVSNRPEVRLARGSVLSSDRGDLTVQACRPHQGRWLVTFEGVADRDSAEGLRGTVLLAEPLIGDEAGSASADPEQEPALWVHELFGCEVVDKDGRSYGKVESVESNPASDLLVLPGEKLVPLVFVVGGPTAGRLVIDPPAGLLD